MSAWKRYRFYTQSDDPRPVKWPPPGPYWRTGESDEAHILVAYIPKGAKLRDYWPEAERVEFTEADNIIFTDRFPCPKWWSEKEAPDGRD